MDFLWSSKRRSEAIESFHVFSKHFRQSWANIAENSPISAACGAASIATAIGTGPKTKSLAIYVTGATANDAKILSSHKSKSSALKAWHQILCYKLQVTLMKILVSQRANVLEAEGTDSFELMSEHLLSQSPEAAAKAKSIESTLSMWINISLQAPIRARRCSTQLCSCVKFQPFWQMGTLCFTVIH